MIIKIKPHKRTVLLKNGTHKLINFPACAIKHNKDIRNSFHFGVLYKDYLIATKLHGSVDINCGSWLNNLNNKLTSQEILNIFWQSSFSITKKELNNNIISPLNGIYNLKINRHVCCSDLNKEDLISIIKLMDDPLQKLKIVMKHPNVLDIMKEKDFFNDIMLATIDTVKNNENDVAEKLLEQIIHELASNPFLIKNVNKVVEFLFNNYDIANQLHIIASRHINTISLELLNKICDVAPLTREIFDEHYRYYLINNNVDTTSNVVKLFVNNKELWDEENIYFALQYSIEKNNSELFKIIYKSYGQNINWRHVLDDAYGYYNNDGSELFDFLDYLYKENCLKKIHHSNLIYYMFKYNSTSEEILNLTLKNIDEDKAIDLMTKIFENFDQVLNITEEKIVKTLINKCSKEKINKFIFSCLAKQYFSILKLVELEKIDNIDVVLTQYMCISTYNSMDIDIFKRLLSGPIKNIDFIKDIAKSNYGKDVIKLIDNRKKSKKSG